MLHIGYISLKNRQIATSMLNKRRHTVRQIICSSTLYSNNITQTYCVYIRVSASVGVEHIYV